eukprot:1192885-Rhodomonas_salina.1
MIRQYRTPRSTIRQLSTAHSGAHRRRAVPGQRTRGSRARLRRARPLHTRPHVRACVSDASINSSGVIP